eukprot:7801394-Pyramimonas_sp.AAC.1
MPVGRSAAAARTARASARAALPAFDARLVPEWPYTPMIKTSVEPARSTADATRPRREVGQHHAWPRVPRALPGVSDSLSP